LIWRASLPLKITLHVLAQKRFYGVKGEAWPADKTQHSIDIVKVLSIAQLLEEELGREYALSSDDELHCGVIDYGLQRCHTGLEQGVQVYIVTGRGTPAQRVGFHRGYFARVSEAYPMQFWDNGPCVFKWVQKGKRVANERCFHTQDAPCNLCGFSQLQAAIRFTEQTLYFTGDHTGCNLLRWVSEKEVQIVRFPVAQLESETGSTRKVEGIPQSGLAQRVTHFDHCMAEHSAWIHFLPSITSIPIRLEGHKV
jgi:hypothetical protein